MHGLGAARELPPPHQLGLAGRAAPVLPLGALRLLAAGAAVSTRLRGKKKHAGVAPRRLSSPSPPCRHAARPALPSPASSSLYRSVQQRQRAALSLVHTVAGARLR